MVSNFNSLKFALLNIKLKACVLKSFKDRINMFIIIFKIVYYYYYYILRLLAKRYKELLAIRLGKPLIDKNLKRPSFAPFLCSSLLINNR